MAIFKNQTLEVIDEKDGIDLKNASLSNGLSAVDFDEDRKYFFMTIDRLLFSNPVSTIKSVLNAHGFVPNLENILSCLDSFTFAVRASCNVRDESDSSPLNAREYLPCIRFELPQKNKVGETLRSFYSEISRYEAAKNKPKAIAANLKTNDRLLQDRFDKLQLQNKDLGQQVRELTQQLAREQKSLTRASRALDLQQILPDNAKICRVSKVDLKRRAVTIQDKKTSLKVPTHLLDRVPVVDARCLVTLDETGQLPIGIVFLDDRQFGGLEQRTAELLYVDGSNFKARDSLRNEFQIRATNLQEEETVKSLKRGNRIVISIAEGYIVRFVLLGSEQSMYFTHKMQEQVLMFSLGRNTLSDADPTILRP